MLLKPSYNRFLPELRQLFERLGYGTVDEKTITIRTMEDLENFITSHSKEEQTEETDDVPSTVKNKRKIRMPLNYQREYLTQFSDTDERSFEREIHVFNLVKPAGRKEMLSLLSILSLM